MYSLQHAASWNLVNQGLLSPFNTPAETVTSLVALQAQNYSSVKTALQTRCRTAFDLEKMLAPGGPLTRLWTIRGTLHIVPTHEAYLHIQATKEEWLTRWGRYLERRLPHPRQHVIQDIYPRIAECLCAEPLTTHDIAAAARLPDKYDRLLPHLLKEMCYLGLAVRGPQPKGKAVFFRPWYPRLKATPAEAQRTLIAKFVAAYGPVTYQDIAYWSGFRIEVVKQALAEIPDLKAIQLEGSRHPAYLPASQFADFHNHRAGSSLPQIRLPAFDVLLLAYKDKSRFISKQHQKEVFLSAGRVLPVVLENGRVTAVWDEKTGAVQPLD